MFKVEINTPHALTPRELYQLYRTSPDGLSKKEVNQRLQEYGPNVLPTAKPAPKLWIFLKQFLNAFVVILSLVLFLSLVLGRWVDGLVVFITILLNVLFSFAQEVKAQKIIFSLKKLIAHRTKVVRAGQKQLIPSDTLVPGDFILIEKGDVVTADIRLISTSNLEINESSLTGESLPVKKIAETLATDTPLLERRNIAFAGTLVIDGYAEGIVIGTGSNTYLSQIATVPKEEPTSHFNIKVNELVRTISAIAFISFALVFVLSLKQSLSLFQSFLASVAILVSTIPEGLPAAITILLALSAQRLYRQNVLVKSLGAIETFGATTVILTDKTGTLTEGKMNVEHIITNSKSNKTALNHYLTNELTPEQVKQQPLLQKIVTTALLLSNAKMISGKFVGHPSEIAFLELGHRFGLDRDEVLSQLIKTDEWLFDEDKNYQTALICTVNQPKTQEVIVQGFPETLLKLSTTIATDSGPKPLHQNKLSEIIAKTEQFAQAGYRITALAYRPVSASTQTLNETLIQDLTFLGLLIITDPLRPEAKQLVETIHRSGIRIVMVTGDYKSTATTIAQAAGLVKNPDSDLIISEEELRELSPAAFEKQIKQGLVFARLTPLTKLKIVETLKKSGEVVLMIGDGVNDAASLKVANIGVAMGISGTEIAKEASDAVLLDDRLERVIEAIREGRVAFENMRKVSFYLLTTNLAELFTTLGGLFIYKNLVLLPIHILWINLVTDGLATIPLILEPSAYRTVLTQAPRHPQEKILTLDIMPFLLLISGFMFLSTLYFFQFYFPWQIERARTFAFSLMAILQLGQALNIRSLSESVFKIGLFSNRWLVLAIIISIIVQFSLTLIPPFQQTFHFVPLSLFDWSLIFLLFGAIVFAGEIYKLFRKFPLR